MKRALAIGIILALMMVSCASIKGTSTLTMTPAKVVAPTIEALKASMTCQPSGVMSKGFIDHENRVLYTAWFDPVSEGPMRFMGFNERTMRAMVWTETVDRSRVAYFAGAVSNVTFDGTDIAFDVEIVMKGTESRAEFERYFAKDLGILILSKASATDAASEFYNKYLFLKNAT